jgi:hypothetical protein
MKNEEFASAHKNCQLSIVNYQLFSTFAPKIRQYGAKKTFFTLHSSFFIKKVSPFYVLYRPDLDPVADPHLP